MPRIPKEFWQEASPGERQRLVQLLLKAVILYPDKLKLQLRTAGIKSIQEAYASTTP